MFLIYRLVALQHAPNPKIGLWAGFILQFYFQY